MKWQTVDKKYIQDAETGEVICFMAKTDDALRDKIPELAPELFTAAFSFVEQIDNGTFAAKSVYNDLKAIFNKVPVELFQDERMSL